MRAVVIGAGLAGLTTALALRKAGIEAVVFERSEDVADRQVGAGIGLPYNATRVFRRLGLLDRIVEAGAPHTGFEFRNWHGKLLASWPVRDGEVDLGIARRTLHRILIDALDPGALVLGAECTGFEQDGDGVTASFSGGRDERGDLLVGADGLYSTIRQQLGVEGERRYAGYSVWRAVERGGVPPRAGWPLPDAVGTRQALRLLPRRTARALLVRRRQRAGGRA